MATVNGFVHLKNKKCDVLDYIDSKTSETKISLPIGGGVNSVVSVFS